MINTYEKALFDYTHHLGMEKEFTDCTLQEMDYVLSKVYVKVPNHCIRAACIVHTQLYTLSANKFGPEVIPHHIRP